MALEEKRNNVKYQGRDDYEVVYYDVPDTGKKYFFLDGGKERLKNGNIIATTSLKVAINANRPEELAEIGVVDSEGHEVIPFTNRKIKVIDDNTLLVEPDKPVSENVIKAIEDRTQPQEATRLVSSANKIKENLNNKMNGNGRFIFNDLFSEATIYDIDGNNLVNNEYYSFVGINDNEMFLIKNDPESEVVTLPLDKEKVEEVVEATEELNTEEVADNLDVSEVKVDENVVEDAFNSEILEDTPTEEVVENNEDNAVIEDTNEEIETMEEPVADVSEEVVEENNTEELNTTLDSMIEEPQKETAVSDDMINSMPATDEDIDEYRFENSQVHVDSIDRSDSFDDLVEDDHFRGSDFADATEIIEEMIGRMKDQDSQINKLESQLNEEKNINRAVNRRNKELEEKNNILNKENNELEEKSNYYKRAAASLATENSNLKAQLEDKDKLLDMLREAKKLLNGEAEPRYDFDEDNVFRRIA